MDPAAPIKILIVDDTAVITKLLEEQISSKYAPDVKCLTAFSGDEARKMLEVQTDIDILISDLEMPGINGITLLRFAGQKYPNMLRILLSGYADFENLTSALNECAICSFITKPWQLSQLFIILDSAISKVKLSRENQFLQESLGKSFSEILSLLEDILAELSPELSGHTQNVAALCERVAGELNLPRESREKLRLAAIFHDIGLLGMPKEIYKTTPSQLAGDLRTMYLRYPEIGSEMLKAIPRLKDIREIIRLHQENMDGTGHLKVSRAQIPLEARILKICDHYDAAVSLRKEEKQKVIAQLNRRSGTGFDRMCLDAFTRSMTRELGEIKIPVSVANLVPGMRLGENAYARSGRMVLSAGASITNLNLKRLRIYHELDPIAEVFIVVENQKNP
ncbi:MAG: hypothetical protein A2X49_17270 [Lentisphaerae bacterium GWF2_52_8]|nr:MAG: hypothetical protein A2X49_17270 [Lentisphaerae bacterium GWF2_52_8]